MSQQEFMKWIAAYAAELESPKMSVTSEYEQGQREAEHSIGWSIMRQLERVEKDN
jgi:hypothetical protein